MVGIALRLSSMTELPVQSGNRTKIASQSDSWLNSHRNEDFKLYPVGYRDRKLISWCVISLGLLFDGIPYFTWIWEWELTLKIENSQFCGKGRSYRNQKLPIFWILLDFLTLFRNLFFEYSLGKPDSPFWKVQDSLTKGNVRRPILYLNRSILRLPWEKIGHPYFILLLCIWILSYGPQLNIQYRLCTLTPCATKSCVNPNHVLLSWDENLFDMQKMTHATVPSVHRVRPV